MPIQTLVAQTHKPSAAAVTRNLEDTEAALDAIVRELVLDSGDGPLGVALRSFRKEWRRSAQSVPARTTPARARQHKPDRPAIQSVIPRMSQAMNDLDAISRQIAALSTTLRVRATRDRWRRTGLIVESHMVTFSDLSSILDDYVLSLSHPGLSTTHAAPIETAAAYQVDRLSLQTTVLLRHHLSAQGLE